MYDSINRLLDETVTSAKGEVLRKYKYTLDKAGRRTKVVESGKGISERTVQYTFDSLGRLEKETVTENAKTSTVSYTFDNLSNRVSKNDNGIVTKYTYDANNRLLTEGNITYTYDKNGNTVTKTENGVTTTYTYFVFGRLKSVSDGTTTESYDYNYQGGRIGKTTNGNTTNYLLDDSGQVYNVLAEYDDALNATSVYTYGTDMISIDNSGTVSYYLTDGQGSTRALTDENGIITDTYTYDAFGNITAQTGDTYNPYLYNQEQYDANTGLYYLRARYMNPSTGRFISMDAYSGSIYAPMSLHKYLYANSSPTVYCDPTGYSSILESLATVDIMTILDFSIAWGAGWAAFGSVVASIRTCQEETYSSEYVARESATYFVNHSTNAFFILTYAKELAAAALPAVQYYQTKLSMVGSNTQTAQTSISTNVGNTNSDSTHLSTSINATTDAVGDASSPATLGANNINTVSSNKRIYYQATTQESANSLINSENPQLTGKEFREVYVWSVQPTKEQVLNSGARSCETVIQFETSASFTKDATVETSLQDYALVSTRPGPISISNVKEVGFQKKGIFEKICEVLFG